MAYTLVVDDDVDVARILKTILEKDGRPVQVAHDGESALRAVGEDLPAVVFLDLMMPGMSGFEVLERLRASPRTATLPVIMLTANTGDEALMRGYATGADYYIPKPFTPGQILRGVRLVTGAKED